MNSISLSPTKPFLHTDTTRHSQPQSSLDSTKLAKRSLRQRLKKIKRIKANNPQRVQALQHLLKDSQMRQARQTRGSNGSSRSRNGLKKQCKRALSNCINGITFGHFEPTADIAQRYAENELNTAPVRKLSDDETIYYSCRSALSGGTTFDNLWHEAQQPQRTALISTSSQPQNIAQLDEHAQLVTNDLDKLKTFIHNTITTNPIGDPKAQTAAIEALEYVLFAFKQDDDAHSATPTQFTCQWLAGDAPAQADNHNTNRVLQITAKSDHPKIGQVVSTSRAPMDFALNAEITLSLSANAQGAVTLNFERENFYRVKLKPEAAKRQCNSLTLAARLAGAVEKTITGLEYSSSAEVQSLTFTPAGTAILHEKQLPSEYWSAAETKQAETHLRTLFDQNAPQAKKAERFAGSAWTMACLAASGGTLSALPQDQLPTAKTSLVLKILRPVELDTRNKPGRIQWQSLPSTTSVTAQIQHIDDAWHTLGALGTVLNNKSGQVVINSKVSDAS